MKASLNKQHPLLFLYDSVNVIICQPSMAFWSLLCGLGVQKLPFISHVFIGTPNGTPNRCQFGVPGADQVCRSSYSSCSRVARQPRQARPPLARRAGGVKKDEKTRAVSHESETRTTLTCPSPLKLGGRNGGITGNAKTFSAATCSTGCWQCAMAELKQRPKGAWDDKSGAEPNCCFVPVGLL